MNELDELLLVLAGIYLVECVGRLPLGAVAVTWGITGRGRVRGPGFVFGQGRAGLFLAGLVPWGKTFISEQWPASFGPDAARPVTRQSIYPDGRAAVDTATTAPDMPATTPYETIRTVTLEDKQVVVNGRVWARAATWPMTRRMARLLVKLRDQPRQDRGTLIESAVIAGFDLKSLDRILGQVRGLLLALQIFCTALFVAVFVALPASYRVFALHQWLPWALGMYAVLMGGICIFYAKIFKSSGLGFGDWGGHVVMMVLAPTVAMRAGHAATRELLAGFDPLAVVATTCPRRVFEAWARQVLRDLRYPRGDAIEAGSNVAADSDAHDKIESGSDANIVLKKDGTADDPAAWFHEQLRTQTEGFARQQGYNVEELLKAPVPHGEDSVAYCPRCHAQFTRVDAACAACGGRPVVPFEGPPGL